jgi:adenine-specific DNA-methyltransferase
MIRDIMNKNAEMKPNDKEIEILKANFPGCFRKDGSFDIGKLAVLLKDKVDITKEGYELNFLGKSYAKLLASMDTETIIKPDIEHNEKEENRNSENIYISGDNLDALKHLLKSYAGKIKCIYIDPPYNTGSDGFVYADNFKFSAEELEDKLGIDLEQAQRILDMTNKGSASHSAWLTFMYPRLFLARDLLSGDGVIFISIDDNEQANLKLLCDDVFGQENFEGHIHWRRRHNQPNDKTKMIGLVAEHILVYAKDSDSYKKSGVGKVDLTGNYSNPDNEPRGDWASKPWKVGSDQSGSRYKIVTPSGTVLDEEWMGDEDTYKSLLADNRIVFPKKGEGMPRKKYFKFEREEEGQCANNWWSHEEFGHNQGANDTLTDLFGEKNVFSNPKPVELLRGIIQISNAKESDYVLDFFSGSATMAHALLIINAEENVKRKYISVQIAEDLDEKLLNANAENKKTIKNAIELLESVNRPHTLDQIGMERIIRASKKIKEETKANIDYGFKHYTLVTPNQNTIDKMEVFDPRMPLHTNIVHDFGGPMVLNTWVVYDGYGLTAKINEINLSGYIAYSCGSHLYLLNEELTSDAVKCLIEKYESDGEFNHDHIVLFGYSFNWNSLQMLKDNIRQIKLGDKRLDIRIVTRY